MSAMTLEGSNQPGLASRIIHRAIKPHWYRSRLPDVKVEFCGTTYAAELLATSADGVTYHYLLRFEDQSYHSDDEFRSFELGHLVESAKLQLLDILKSPSRTPSQRQPVDARQHHDRVTVAV